MKYRLELKDGTVLWSEDVTDLLYYLRIIGYIGTHQAFEIFRKVNVEGFTLVDADCFTIEMEVEADV